MAVTSRNLPSEQRAAQPRSRLRYLRAFAYGVTLVLAALAAYVLVGVLLGRIHTMADDLRYGRPRTMQLDGYVGHNEVPGRPTHLIALNLNRQVVLIELPGGDAAQARSISGPYLFGAGEDLTPVHIQLEDIDRDGQLDLVLQVRQEQVIYLNREGAFRLATAGEQAEISQRNQP